MTTALLLISLFLNALALFAIIILYQRQNKFFQMEKKQQAMLREMEDVISTYLTEMKEENETLIETIQKMQPKQAIQRKTNSGTPTSTPSLPDQPPVSATQTRGTRNQAMEAYKSHLSVENDDEVESVEEVSIPPVAPKVLTMEEQAIRLEEQGYTIDEIARKLERGRTEIELMLKFRQNSQE